MREGSPVSAVVLTHNEARNLAPCLQSLAALACEILVVDSGSSDGTQAIAEQLGATVVHHPFTSHVEQWAFALAQPLRGAWVLAIDADQRVTPELASGLLRLAREAGPEVHGVYVNRLHAFRGTPLRHGGLFPKWMLKMFRAGEGRTDARDLLDHRFYVRGGSVRASGLLLEDNRNEADIGVWIEKHNRYAARQALEEYRRRRGEGGWPLTPRPFGTPDERVLWLKSLWFRLPLYTRPVLYFVYRYLIRLGFLDGKQGFVFHALQAFWFRLLVDIRLDELESRGEPRGPSKEPLRGNGTSR